MLWLVGTARWEVRSSRWYSVAFRSWPEKSDHLENYPQERAADEMDAKAEA